MDRLVSSWQKIGDSVNSYTYYSYDNMGRAYKSDFRLSGATGGSLSQTYTSTYDSEDGSLASMNVSYTGATPISETISYTYDGFKRISAKTYSGGLNYNYTYQSLGSIRSSYLVDGFTARFDSRTLYAYNYTYDALVNITKITNNGSTVAEYTYDDQGQLTSETIVSQNIKYEYYYDTYGNLYWANKYNLTTGAFIEGDTCGYGSTGYGDSNGWHDRLYTFNDEGITYDDIGNPLLYYNGKETYNFTWQNGRELARTIYGHTTVTYKYGADGLRTVKSIDGGNYNYYYSDGKLVRQIWADGETIDFLYDESGTPYSFIYNGTQYYYVKNLQGDVMSIANADGGIVVNYVYDAWGNILSTTGSMASTVGAVNPIRYRSYYYDTDTGFYYLQTRYYDPAIRRFINADGVVSGVGGDILGYNQYAYCFNNPVNMSDNEGNWPEWIKNTVKWGAKNIVKPVV